jgi:hypothetical protein
VKFSGLASAKWAIRVIVLSTVAAWLLWMWAPVKHNPPTQAAESTDASAGFAPVAERDVHAQSINVEHSHEAPEGLDFQSPDDFRQQAHWFETPNLGADGLFPIKQTPLQIDESCAGRTELSHASLEAALQANLGVDPREPAPDNILVEEIAQFWQLSGQYFQISGRWDRDMPPRYAIHHFSASDPQFSENVKNLPLPSAQEFVAPQSDLDLQSLSEYFGRVITDAQSAGALIGSRLVHAMPSPGDEAQDLKLNNGRVVSWMFGHGRCQLRTTGDAYCRCVSKSEVQPKSTEQEPFRVND